ncbi:hypothetical protein J2W22_000120 [Sphingomonas kyeonggiensis]|uniref:hypothetical protein n=1 Tax=Sphingomonas kyeonggiensis TaxID=1268553 RepID=UPI00278AC3DB|nr:hypothetical protein [Sphingomonas kyeonggiensis]MDQ0248073.1 hypothetical protein [Sphingomonas kyeonggiensis]
MFKFAQRVVLGFAMGAAALTAFAPSAEAQRYRGGYGHHYRGHDDTGTAIVAGIAGLAIGAAIASSNNDRRYDYDRGYYRDHGYYPTDGYYYRNHYRSYRGYCETRRVWDPYLDRPVRVRYCR